MKLSAAVTVKLLFSTAVAFEPLQHILAASLNAPADNDNCPAATTAECGSIYTDGVITLGQDLVCAGNLTDVDDSLNAAITLNGPDTVLDCQGYTISQSMESIGSAVDCEVSGSASSGERRKFKQICKAFFFAGIIVEGGATVRNCIVQQFAIGSFLPSGQGVIEDSDFTLNKRATQVQVFPPNNMVKIIRSNFYNNWIGPVIYQSNKAGAEVILSDITSKNNLVIGMQLSGTGVTLRNAEVSGNGDSGINILPFPFYEITEDPTQLGPNNARNTEISLEGQISSYNNGKNGIDIFNFFGVGNGTVALSGNINTYLNGASGIAIERQPDFYTDNSDSFVDISLEKGGSIAACNNGVNDILNDGNGTISGLGLGKYTCNSLDGTGILPECKSCPSCYTSLKSPPFVTGRGNQGKVHAFAANIELGHAGHDDSFPNIGLQNPGAAQKNLCGSFTVAKKCNKKSGSCVWNGDACVDKSSDTTTASAKEAIVGAETAKQPNSGNGMQQSSALALAYAVLVFSGYYL